MRIEWKDNRANVGPLELRVRQARSSGLWCADAWVSLRTLSSESGFESDAKAREWCERFVKAFVVPIADAAGAEGAAAEREACARELNALADEAQRELDSTSASERTHRGQLLAQRAMLSKAVATIRARSNGGAR